MAPPSNLVQEGHLGSGAKAGGTGVVGSGWWYWLCLLVGGYDAGEDAGKLV
jgi:hypothetical protein